MFVCCKFTTVTHDVFIHYWLQCGKHSKTSIPDLVIGVIVWKSCNAAERAWNVHGDRGSATVQQGTRVWQAKIKQGWWPQDTNLSDMVGLQVSCVSGRAQHLFLYKCLSFLSASLSFFLSVLSFKVWSVTIILSYINSRQFLQPLLLGSGFNIKYKFSWME